MEPLEPSTPQRPLVELLRLAAPTVLQMASYTLMQFLDTWMLAHYGQSRHSALEPTAASNSGLFGFAVISLGMGVLWVVNTFVSQAYGRKDYTACGRFLWQGIWVAIGYAVLLLPALPYVPQIFTLFGHEPQLVRMESAYLQIVVGASILKLTATALQQFLLAIDRAYAVMISTIFGVATNALAAWALIFGHLGFEPMGVVGAAWAQNIGVGVEMLVAIAFVASPTIRRTFNVRDWLPRPAEIRTLLKVGVPAGMQIVADVGAWSIWGNLVMGLFGTNIMAANSFVFRYMSVSFMPAFGISVAVTALVGRYIGRGEPEIARSRANLGFMLAGVYMLVCGLLFVLFRHPLMSLFAKEPEVLAAGATILIFAGVYQCFDAMYIVYNGALRGAGDTFVPAVATAVLCWGITVLGGYTVARQAPQLGPSGPWIAATAYGIILGVFMYLRFRRGAWQRIRLEAEPISQPAIESATVAAS